MECSNQKNPVEYREKKILLPDDLLDIYFMTYHVPLGENDISYYLADAMGFEPNSVTIIDALPEEELRIIIESKIREELIMVHQNFIEQLKGEAHEIR